VRVSFTYGTNLDEAANELRSRLDRRRAALPEDMEPPVLYKFDVSQFPIMFLTVAASDMDLKSLRYFVEKNIQYRLERPGSRRPLPIAVKNPGRVSEPGTDP
jgi:HAE1 family hydrophobic/amphiphilic exporter-1